MDLIGLLCVLLCAALLMTGCMPAYKPFESGPSESGPSDYVGPTESTPTEPPVLNEAPPKSLKVLAIGGSFSMDAMQYLYQIAEEAGVEEIVLGNLFYGGGSLSSHLTCAKEDSPSYDFYKNTDGSWQLNKEYRISQALVEEEWDYITFQQVSGYSGISSSYDTLAELMDYVQERNSTAKLVWHMTWAYQADSTHEDFPRYDNDQQKMYSQIVDCVQQCVLPDERIAFVIPAGTAIQNARTSFIGDTLTRDGFHLDKQIGRYVAGLTWYAAITRAPIDGITFNPSKMTISEDMLAVAREAAENAVATPYAVTQSEIIQSEQP